MGILNTFYILFKSNAEDVIKGNKAIEKSTKETERALKNTNEEAKTLGQSFVKTVEGLASVGGAIAGFNILKTGVDEATAFNAQLKVMADLTGQNAGTLKQMGQAAAAAGGSAAGALGDIQALSNMAAQSGKPLGPVNEYFQAVRDRLKNYTPNERQAALNRIGINDPGNRWLLSVASDEEYERRMGRAATISPLSQSSADAAFRKLEIESELGGAKATWYANLWDTIKNPVNSFNKWRTDVTLGASDSSGGAISGATAILGGSTVGAGALIKALLSGSTAASALGSTGILGGALLTGVGAGYGLTSLFSKPIENMMVRMMGHNPDLANGPLSNALKTGHPVLDFWLGRGYSREQAAGIMANIHHESGGNPAARGDGGRAHGLFQWHPDRQRNIFKNTGINVSAADYMSQLEAAAWEMKHGRDGFRDSYYRTIKDPAQAAAYFSKYFESPANGAVQALLRGKTALGMVSQFPAPMGGGGGASVKIDKIEINTQATDAAGIASDLRDEIYSQLSYIEANYDDGVDK